MDQQQYQQFCQILSTQTGIQSDQQIRKQGEETLKQFIKDQPDLYIRLCLVVLKDHQDKSYKQLVNSQLRKTLSQFSESSFDKLWSKISSETKEMVKTELFIVLNTEQDVKLRRHICETIGEIGGSVQEIFEINENQAHEWPNLLDTLWEMFRQSNTVLIECAFWILSSLIELMPDLLTKHKNDLFTLFKNGISQQGVEMKFAAMTCCLNWVLVCDSKIIKEFDQLLLPILEGMIFLLEKDIDRGEEVLSLLENIAENEPKFFKKHYESLYQAMHKIFTMKDMDKSIKQQGVDILIIIIERLSNIINNKPDLQNNICELIFYLMVENDVEITEEWRKPAEGFNDDNEDDEEDSTKFGMNCIDRFISNIEQSTALKVIGNTVQKLLQNPNWRYQYAALMALSQVGEYIEDIEQVDPIIQLIGQYFNNSNDKIRYAVCHSIGQIADDMKPDFQEKYHATILPHLIQICNDPCPRVSSHGFAAITNFVESIEKELIKDQLENILKISFQALQNGISIAKENAVSTIAATAEAAKNYFIPYFSEAMPILFNVYETHSQKEYKQLRGQTIECITLIAHGVPKEVFLPYFEKTINILIALQESEFEQVDPQKSYVLSGWQRLCLIFHTEFIPYLNRIIPTLYKLIDNVFQLENKFDENQANTYDKDEAEIAIHMLAVFINQFKTSFAPYVQITTDKIAKLCQNGTSQNIRIAASKCLSGLIECVKNQQQLATELTKHFLDVLYETIQNEYDTEVMCSLAMSMKECLEQIDSSCFTGDELNTFAEKLFKMLFESDERKAESQKCQNDDDLDDDEKQLLDEDFQNEEDFHVTIAEVIGELFRTHKELSTPIADKIYSGILPKVLADNLSFRMHKFGVYLISDMIEYLGYTILANHWPHLLEALLKFSQYKNLQVRQASVYGVGIFAKMTPPEVFGQFKQPILDALNKSLDITNKNEQKYPEKYNNKCKNNIISSFGKIIKYQHQNVNVQELINFWIQHLPIKYDRKEGLINHYLLCDILFDSPQILFTNQENYSIVLSIFAQILGTKLATETMTVNIKKSLSIMGQNEYVKANWANITSKLTQIQVDKLNACMISQ